jgi:hypothetical protein
MALVQMPDGQLVDMPDQLDSQLGARLRAFQKAQAGKTAAPTDGDMVPPDSQIPKGFYAVTGDDGHQTMRRNLGGGDIVQMLHDLPGVGTLTNMTAGTLNLGTKALSGVAGLLSGGNPDVVRNVQQKLNVQLPPSRDPILQAMGTVQSAAARRARPLDETIAGLPPGPRTAIEAAAEAIPDIASIAPGFGVTRASRAAGPLDALSAGERAVFAARGKVPTTSELRTLGNEAYARADEAGLVIRPESAERLKKSIADAIADEGGADPTLHARTAAVLRRVADEQPRTLQDVDRMRQLARDAASSGDPADARLARKIIGKIDDYSEKLSTLDVSAGRPDQAVQSLRDARDYWSRFRKSEVIDELVRKAEIDAASNYSQSGLENALRKHFRQLAKSDDLRMFAPEERAAIEKVAKGGPVENALRYVGKFAPHGVVSAAALGAFGEAHGAGGALATAGLAELGRRAATRMTKQNVQRTSELVRRGTQRGAKIQEITSATPAPRTLALPAPLALRGLLYGGGGLNLTSVLQPDKEQSGLLGNGLRRAGQLSSGAY